MVLYVSVVLLGTLAVLPAGHEGSGTPVHGPVGGDLIAIVWGTTIGLALAHWFAFHIATHGVAAAASRGQDFMEAMAQLAGAAFVAAATTIPVLLLGPAHEQRAVMFVLALIVGGADYVVERTNGRSRRKSAMFAVIALLIALAVATVKVALTSH